MIRVWYPKWYFSSVSNLLSDLLNCKYRSKFIIGSTWFPVRGHIRCCLLFPGTYSNTWIFLIVRVSWVTYPCVSLYSIMHLKLRHPRTHYQIHVSQHKMSVLWTATMVMWKVRGIAAIAFVLLVYHTTALYNRVS